MSKPKPIASPCINICTVTPFHDARPGICTGCGRTLDEIAAWAAMSDAGRRAIMTELPERIAALGAKASAPMLALARIRTALET